MKHEGILKIENPITRNKKKDMQNPPTLSGGFLCVYRDGSLRVNPNHINLSLQDHDIKQRILVGPLRVPCLYVPLNDSVSMLTFSPSNLEEAAYLYQFCMTGAAERILSLPFVSPRRWCLIEKNLKYSTEAYKHMLNYNEHGNWMQESTVIGGKIMYADAIAQCSSVGVSMTAYNLPLEHDKIRKVMNSLLQLEEEDSYDVPLLMDECTDHNFGRVTEHLKKQADYFGDKGDAESQTAFEQEASRSLKIAECARDLQRPLEDVRSGILPPFALILDKRTLTPIDNTVVSSFLLLWYKHCVGDLLALLRGYADDPPPEFVLWNKSECKLIYNRVSPASGESSHVTLSVFSSHGKFLIPSYTMVIPRKLQPDIKRIRGMEKLAHYSDLSAILHRYNLLTRETGASVCNVAMEVGMTERLLKQETELCQGFVGYRYSLYSSSTGQEETQSIGRSLADVPSKPVNANVFPVFGTLPKTPPPGSCYSGGEGLVLVCISPASCLAITSTKVEGVAKPAIAIEIRPYDASKIKTPVDKREARLLLLKHFSTNRFILVQEGQHPRTYAVRAIDGDLTIRCGTRDIEAKLPTFEDHMRLNIRVSSYDQYLRSELRSAIVPDWAKPMTPFAESSRYPPPGIYSYKKYPLWNQEEDKEEDPTEGYVNLCDPDVVGDDINSNETIKSYKYPRANIPATVSAGVYLWGFLTCNGRVTMGNYKAIVKGKIPDTWHHEFDMIKMTNEGEKKRLVSWLNGILKRETMYLLTALFKSETGRFEPLTSEHYLKTAVILYKDSVLLDIESMAYEPFTFLPHFSVNTVVSYSESGEDHLTEVDAELSDRMRYTNDLLTKLSISDRSGRCFLSANVTDKRVKDEIFALCKSFTEQTKYPANFNLLFHIRNLFQALNFTTWSVGGAGKTHYEVMFLDHDNNLRFQSTGESVSTSALSLLHMEDVPEMVSYSGFLSDNEEASKYLYGLNSSIKSPIGEASNLPYREHNVAAGNTVAMFVNSSDPINRFCLLGYTVPRKEGTGGLQNDGTFTQFMKVLKVYSSYQLDKGFFRGEETGVVKHSPSLFTTIDGEVIVTSNTENLFLIGESVFDSTSSLSIDPTVRVPTDYTGKNIRCGDFVSIQGPGAASPFKGFKTSSEATGASSFVSSVILGGGKPMTQDVPDHALLYQKNAVLYSETGHSTVRSVEERDFITQLPIGIRMNPLFQPSFQLARAVSCGVMVIDKEILKKIEEERKALPDVPVEPAKETGPPTKKTDTPTKPDTPAKKSSKPPAKKASQPPTKKTSQPDEQPLLPKPSGSGQGSGWFRANIKANNTEYAVCFFRANGNFRPFFGTKKGESWTVLTETQRNNVLDNFKDSLRSAGELELGDAEAIADEFRTKHHISFASSFNKGEHEIRAYGGRFVASLVDERVIFTYNPQDFVIKKRNASKVISEEPLSEFYHCADFNDSYIIRANLPTFKPSQDTLHHMKLDIDESKSWDEALLSDNVDSWGETRDRSNLILQSAMPGNTLYHVKESDDSSSYYLYQYESQDDTKYTAPVDQTDKWVGITVRKENGKTTYLGSALAEMSREAFIDKYRKNLAIIPRKESQSLMVDIVRAICKTNHVVKIKNSTSDIQFWSLRSVIEQVEGGGPMGALDIRLNLLNPPYDPTCKNVVKAFPHVHTWASQNSKDAAKTMSVRVKKLAWGRIIPAIGKDNEANAKELVNLWKSNASKDRTKGTVVTYLNDKDELIKIITCDEGDGEKLKLLTTEESLPTATAVDNLYFKKSVVVIDETNVWRLAPTYFSDRVAVKAYVVNLVGTIQKIRSIYINYTTAGIPTLGEFKMEMTSLVNTYQLNLKLVTTKQTAITAQFSNVLEEAPASATQATPPLQDPTTVDVYLTALAKRQADKSNEPLIFPLKSLNNNNNNKSSTVRLCYTPDAAGQLASYKNDSKAFVLHCAILMEVIVSDKGDVTDCVMQKANLDENADSWPTEADKIEGLRTIISVDYSANPVIWDSVNDYSNVGSEAKRIFSQGIAAFSRIKKDGTVNQLHGVKIEALAAKTKNYVVQEVPLPDQDTWMVKVAPVAETLFETTVDYKNTEEIELWNLWDVEHSVPVISYIAPPIPGSSKPAAKRSANCYTQISEMKSLERYPSSTDRKGEMRDVTLSLTVTGEDGKVKLFASNSKLQSRAFAGPDGRYAREYVVMELTRATKDSKNNTVSDEKRSIPNRGSFILSISDQVKGKMFNLRADYDVSLQFSQQRKLLMINMLPTLSSSPQRGVVCVALDYPNYSFRVEYFRYDLERY